MFVRTKQLHLLAILVALLLVTSACAPSAARLNNSGNNLFEKEEYGEALEQYREAIAENPDLTEPYYNSGNAYHEEGNLESAITRLKQANRTAEGEIVQHSNYNLGNSFYKAETWESAIEAYKEALRLNPEDADAKYNLELALKQLEQQQQQQQQQQGGGGGQQQPDQNNEGGGQGEQNQPPGDNGDQEQQGGGGNQPEENEQGQGQGDNQEQEAPGGRSLTQQEAEQLLDALGQDSQTLQERLQEGFFAPGRLPEQDW
jgi:Ca-activated chloride channel family protein